MTDTTESQLTQAEFEQRMSLMDNPELDPADAAPVDATSKLPHDGGENQ